MDKKTILFVIGDHGMTVTGVPKTFVHPNGELMTETFF